MTRIKVKLNGCDSEYMNNLKDYFLVHGCSNIIFEDSDEAVTVTIGEEDCEIYMYQKASSIYSRIMNIYLKKTKHIEQAYTDKKAVFIGIVSSDMKIAEKVCCKFSLKGYKVLYLCPDTYMTVECPFRDSNERDFSELYYYIQDKEIDLNMVIESLASYDELKKVYFIKNRYHTPDIFLNKAEMLYLINHLEKNQIYDYIVFHLPAYIAESHMELIKSCDELTVSSEKIKSLLKEHGIERFVAYE